MLCAVCRRIVRNTFEEIVGNVMYRVENRTGAELWVAACSGPAEGDCGEFERLPDGSAEEVELPFGEFLLDTTTAEGASEEFVELQNRCFAPVHVEGVDLVYRSRSGTHDVVLATLEGSLDEGEVLVIGHDRWSGTPEVEFRAGGLSASGGGLSVRTPGGRDLDRVGWGPATNAFVRGMTAPAPGDGESISRVANTGDHGSDYALTDPSPGVVAEF